MKLNLVIHYAVACPLCGYRRYLTESEAENWKRGEHASGSQSCPACSRGSNGKGLSAAQESGFKSDRSVMV
jgi:uncharacterized Zn finger protein (UPF0148 family)